MKILILLGLFGAEVKNSETYVEKKVSCKKATTGFSQSNSNARNSYVQVHITYLCCRLKLVCTFSLLLLLLVTKIDGQSPNWIDFGWDCILGLAIGFELG